MSRFAHGALFINQLTALKRGAAWSKANHGSADVSFHRQDADAGYLVKTYRSDGSFAGVLK